LALIFSKVDFTIRLYDSRLRRAFANTTTGAKFKASEIGGDRGLTVMTEVLGMAIGGEGLSFWTTAGRVESIRG
jgi:hypothetical protein